MKGGKIFAQIVYYIFTALIGVFLALTLPQYFFTFNKLPKRIVDALDEGDVYTAALLTSNFFNGEPVLDVKLADGSGLVLFESVMENEAPADDDENAPYEHTLYKTFWGFLYGTEDRYVTYSRESNKTELLVTQQDGTTVSVRLLDFDNNDDGKADGITTFNNFGFILLSLPQSQIDSVAKLQFLDVNGDTYCTVETQPLRFDTAYFSFFDEFSFQDQSNYIELNNNYVGQLNSPSITAQQWNDISGLRNRMNEKFIGEYIAAGYSFSGETNPEYAELNNELNKQSNILASVIIVSYFVVIYVIGDFLLGGHYILRFFDWFLFTVCKIPRKQKKSPKREEVYGHDYFSMVTLKLDTSAVPEFSGSVEIKYTNSDSEAKWTLLKAENYTSTQRIKAGVYVNPHIDINRSYAPVDLPDNLEVEGYRIERLIKIVKRDAPVEATQEAGQTETPAQPDIGQQTPSDTKQEN